MKRGVFNSSRAVAVLYSFRVTPFSCGQPSSCRSSPLGTFLTGKEFDQAPPSPILFDPSETSLNLSQSIPPTQMETSELLKLRPILTTQVNDLS